MSAPTTGKVIFDATIPRASSQLEEFATGLKISVKASKTLVKELQNLRDYTTKMVDLANQLLEVTEAAACYAAELAKEEP